MQMPIVVLFDVRGKTVAFSPRYFAFQEIGYKLEQPIKLLYDGEVDVSFVKQYDSINDTVREEFDEQMHEFAPNEVTDIYINSTNVCAGKCTYCYADPVMVNSDKVNFDDFMDAVDSINSRDTLKTVTLLGGEPLLNLPLIERILNETTFGVSISTGLFLNDDTFEKFMELTKMFSDRIAVQCSIDPTNKYRPGKHSDQLYERAERLLREVPDTTLRSTICSKDINYRKMRNEYEQKLNKEIACSFEIVSTPVLWPSTKEWYNLLSYLILDAHEYLRGERAEMALDAHIVADNILTQYKEGHSNFYIANGCSMYSGSIPVITPDTIKDKAFQRCTQPMTPEEVKAPFIMPEKCIQCEILRYCGVSCPAEAAVPSYCDTQLLKHLITIYIFLWRNDEWN